ncbi:MAG: hypothetical protein ABIQ95_02195, partial [Bdellovibrionia bacterium]
RDPKHTDLRIHLENYRENLLSAKELFDATPIEKLVKKKKYRSLGFARFYRTYEAWLETSLLDVDAKIKLIN